MPVLLLADLVSARPASRADIDGPYAWARMVVSLFLGSFGAVGIWAIVVVLPAVQEEFGVERADASIPYTLAMIGFGAGNMLIGRAIDRHGVILPLLVATVTLAIGFVAAAFTTSLWPFALIHLAIGFGNAATFAPLMADISHWFDKRRGIAVATVACGNYLAGAVWPLVISWALGQGGWRFAYILIGVLCLVAMAPTIALLRRPSPRLGIAGSAMAIGAKSIDLSPRMLQAMLMVAGFGCCMAMAMPQVHIVAYCADLGYGPARGAEMLSLMLGAGIVSRLGSGFLADRIGGVKTLLIGSVLQGLALFLYLPFDALVSLYVVSFVFGLSQGGIVPSYAVIVREYMAPQEAGRRIGLVIMATVVGMAVGGWMSGWIYDLTGSYAAAFINGIAFNVLNVAVMLLILWRGSTRTPKLAAA